MDHNFSRSRFLAGNAGHRAGLVGFILVVFFLGVFVLWRDLIVEHMERMRPVSMQEQNFRFKETSAKFDPVCLPDVPSLRAHEASLPQQNEQNARVGRFVRFQSQHHWGIGFNNLWLEFILLAAIAERSNRSYVFRDLVRAGGVVPPDGFDDTRP